MKNIIQKFLAAFVFMGIISFVQQADAYVIDEVRMKSAQSDYEGYYTLVQTYKGTESGVTFESYSPKWNTAEKLKALEDELLRNKYGEEIKLLGKIIILPDYLPNNKNVLGQYIASYQYTNTSVKLLPDRKIYLFGGNDYTTPEAMAFVLSHEYGHHFTYYYLLNKENKRPGTWLTSAYAKARGFGDYSRVHDSVTGEYEWAMSEILAEDYVQLFGSANAIKNSAQMNVFLPTPFDKPESQSYWSETLGGDFALKAGIPFYLKDFEVNPFNSSMYNLQVQLKNLEGKKTYVRAKEGTGVYAPVTLDTLSGLNETSKWYKYAELPSAVNWVLSKSMNNEVAFTAIQYETKGFNKGSQTLRLNYENLNSNVATEEEINREVYKDAKVYTMAEKKEMIREAALKYGIPPEVLKAIAFVETGMKQFDAEGNPVITEDGGIGIMQITASEAELEADGIDPERLKRDTGYNIETGAKWLKKKWNNNNLPKVNDKDPNEIESWYFAIMAYNGLSKRNDPNLQYGKPAYQERVFEVIRSYSNLPIAKTPKINIKYPYPDKPDIMSFVDAQYDWPGATESTQMWAGGETLYSWNHQLSYSKLRNGVNGAESAKLVHYTPLKIIDGPYETANDDNQYVMYKVAGNGFEGYTASSNLRNGNVTVFPDVKFGDQASSIAFLQMRGIISGHADGTFKPNDSLLRRHGAAMLVKELGLTLPQGYKMKATDMKPTDLGYNDMLIAEAYGLMTGSNGKLRPKENLTRAQMAAILARAYGNVYERPTFNAVFTDVKPGDWSYNSINSLSYNGITKTSGGAFMVNQPISRAHFSMFLKRTIELKEK